MRTMTTTAAALVLAAGSAWAQGSYCSPVYSLSASGPTKTDMTLYWTSPYEGINYCPSGYEGRYSDQDPNLTSYDNWWNGAGYIYGLPVPTSSYQYQSFVVTGLIPGRMYWFMLRGFDTYGAMSDYGNYANCKTTTDSVNPGSPTMVTAQAGDEGEITMQWVSSGDDGSVGTAASYEMAVSQNTNTSNVTGWWASATPNASVPFPWVSGTPQTGSFKWLPPSTEYTVGFRAVDLAGNRSTTVFLPAVTTGAPHTKGGGGDRGNLCSAPAGAGALPVLCVALLGMFALARR